MLETCYCNNPKCKQEIQDNSKFCLYCGTDLILDQVVSKSITPDKTTEEKVIANSSTSSAQKNSPPPFVGCLMLIFIILMCSGLITFLVKGKSSRPSVSDIAAKVKISNIRIVPFTAANGIRSQKVLCDITNGNDFPIDDVFVNIDAYYNGNQVTNEYPNWHSEEACIYTSLDADGQLIQPGATYSQQGEEGSILLSNLYGHVSDVKMTPTQAYKEGQFDEDHSGNK